MKILVQVFLDTPTKIRKDMGDLGAWDFYGVSEALNSVLPQFAASNFVYPSSDSGEYKVAYSIDKKYAWQVFLADDSEIGKNEFPVIMLYDLGTQEYVARLEGTPKTSDDVKALFKSVLVKRNIKRVVSFSLSGLALLATPVIKDKKTKITVGVLGGSLLVYSIWDYFNEIKKDSNTVLETLATAKNILFFTSPSCGACRVLKPKVEDIAKKTQTSLILIDSNTEGGKRSHIEAGVTVLPVVIVTDKENRQLKRWDGGITLIENELPQILKS
jgi:thiol-disulfide isomerase/thioredoxin